MWLSTGPLFEFTGFLQIILWILLPVALLVMSLTIVAHQRKRKRIAREAAIADDPIIPDELLASGKGAHVLFDHTGLVRQYRNKLSYNHARYAALKSDFAQLEQKYKTLTTLHPELHHQPLPIMENTQQPVINNDYEMEKQELLRRIDDINHAYKTLEQENESLVEQLNLRSGSEEDKSIVINTWKEENLLLKKQLAEQACMSDLLEEKGSHVQFLQNQLELRIRDYHRMDQQHQSMIVELEKAKGAMAVKDTVLDNSINSLEEKAREAEQLQQELVEKKEQLIYLENALPELKAQNELLNAELADTRERSGLFEEQWKQEQARSMALQQKLLSNKQLMLHLYHEFSVCMEQEKNVSPVINLQGTYSDIMHNETCEEAVTG